MADNTSQELPLIPQELIWDILSRLPVQSLIRFKCVCKSWFSLLSCPDFIATHLQRSRSRRFYLLKADDYIPAPDNRELISEYPLPMYRLIPDPDPSKSYLRHIFALVQEDNLDRPIHVETPKPYIPHIISTTNCRKYLDLDIVGSIDGLFCLSLNCGTCVVLWNPATREFYQVPDAKISQKGLSGYSYGFAYHNGHKVVRLVCDNPSSRYFPVSKVRAEAFDLKTNSWSEITDPPQVVFSRPTCGTILNGVPYWPMDYDVFASKKSEWIISFSPSQSKFNMIKRPDFGFRKKITWRVGTVGDSLVTFVQDPNNSIDIWMKMDDLVGDKVSWTKQLSVGPVAGIETWTACWKNGEFLVSNGHEFDFKKEMFLYDPWKGEARIFPEIRPQDHDRSPIEVSVFSESLVPPHYHVDC